MDMFGEKLGEEAGGIIGLGIDFKDGSAEFDSDEEFLSEYALGNYKRAGWSRSVHEQGSVLSISALREPPETTVSVRRASRAEIDRIFNLLQEQIQAATVPEPPSAPPPRPTIFIGHGHSNAWRDLKDHLHEQHGYPVEAYETGARAGHTIRDILQGMANRAAFAVLVMTAEDQQTDGTYRARQNVVHEAGLFQGRLGFDRAIVAIEEGVEPFSNLQGVHQIRFTAGNIREIYGDVLATLRREFDTS